MARLWLLDLLHRQALPPTAARLFLERAQDTFSEAMEVEIRKLSDA